MHYNYDVVNRFLEGDVLLCGTFYHKFSLQKFPSSMFSFSWFLLWVLLISTTRMCFLVYITIFYYEWVKKWTEKEINCLTSVQKRNDFLWCELNRTVQSGAQFQATICYRVVLYFGRYSIYKLKYSHYSNSTSARSINMKQSRSSTRFRLSFTLMLFNEIPLKYSECADL